MSIVSDLFELSFVSFARDRLDRSRRLTRDCIAKFAN